jgi:hypothetical protein
MASKLRQRTRRKRSSGGSKRKTSGGGGSDRRGAYLARTTGGQNRRTTGRGTATSFGPAGSGSAGSGKSETERLQSQLAGAQSLQRRTMAQLGAGDINKKQSKGAMRRANDRIRESARGLANLQGGFAANQGNLVRGGAEGRARFDQIMRGVTGAKGSNFYNMSKGILKPGQNIGGTNRPQGFSPYQGKDMRMGLNKFAPISQGISRVMEKGSFLPFPLKGMAAKRYEDTIKDTPRTLADLGVDTTTAAQSLRNVPEGQDQLYNEMLGASQRQPGLDNRGIMALSQRSPQMDFGAPTTYDPYAKEGAIGNLLGRIPLDDYRTQNLQAFYPDIYRSSGAPMDTGFVPAPTADQLATQEGIEAIRRQIDLNTGILANLPPGVDPTRVGSVQGSGQGLMSVFDMQDFVNKNPTTIYPQGFPTQMMMNR